MNLMHTFKTFSFIIFLWVIFLFLGFLSIKHIAQTVYASSILDVQFIFFTYTCFFQSLGGLFAGIGIALPAFFLALIYGWLQVILLFNGFVLPELLREGFIETLLDMLKHRLWG